MHRHLTRLALLALTCCALTACGPEENEASNNKTANNNTTGIPDLTNPLKDDAAAATEGQSTFTSQCSSCHGTAGMPTENSVSKKKLSETAADATDGYIFTVIQKGGPAVGSSSTMPSYSSFSDTQIWQLVTYIRTLKP